MSATGASFFSLPRLEHFSSTLRTMFINVGFFAATILLIPAVATQFATNAVVIEPIAVPQALTDRGLSSEVVANRLWDGLQDFTRTANLARATLVAIPNNQKVEFSLPDTGISIDSIAKHFRQFFGLYETHIAGEILCGTADCAPENLRLRLRVIRGRMDVVDLPPMAGEAEADYFRDAAAGVFDVLDPFVAIAARAISDPEGAASRARRLAASEHPDAKWAFNLLGDIARNAGNLDEAIVDYQSALALDDGFNLPRIGLARAQAARGDTAAAEATIAEAARRDPRLEGLEAAQGEVALAAGKGDAAVGYYLAAAARNPVDPQPLADAGRIELDLGKTADAIGHLNEALDLDPGHAEALKLLGRTYHAQGEFAAAERMFRNWVDYAPNSADAHLALAGILVERDKLEDAASEYGTLARLLPDQRQYVLQRAMLLEQLKLYPQAVDVLAPLADAAAPDAGAVLLLAQVQDVAGRKTEAADRYRQFLTLDPDQTERQLAEAALAALD